MGKDVRTNVVITAETKGLDRALQQILGLNKESLDALKEQAGAFTAVEKSLKLTEIRINGIWKQQQALAQQMDQISDKGSDAYQALQKEMQKADDQAKSLNRSLNLQRKIYQDEAEAATRLERAHAQIRQGQQRAQEKAQGAFGQGFLQAVLPPSAMGMAPLFLERGPGMRQQAFGQLAGTALRRAGEFGWGMTGGIAFGGLQGMQAGLSAIPLVGGLAAGQLGAAAGFVGQSLAYERQRVDLTPFLSDLSHTIVTRQRSAAEVESTKREENFTRLKAERIPTAISGIWDRALSEAAFLNQRGPLAGQTAMSLAQMAGDPAKKQQLDDLIGSYASNQQAAIWAQIESANAKAPAVVLRGRAEMLNAGGGFGNLGGPSAANRAIQIPAPQFAAWQKQVSPADLAAQAGLRFRGLGRPEALQETAALFRAAGGRFGQGIGGLAAQQQFLGLGMAAQTLYGAGPEITGAFGLAGRRGGLVGAQGLGADKLTQAIRDANALGLEDSEVPQYLQVIASGIQNFQQTGIPMNQESLASMAQLLGQTGMQTQRALAVSQQFQGYVQGIPGRGPQGGLDLALMQAFGGYRGGGPTALQKSYIQMEQMTAQLREQGLGGVKAGTTTGDFMSKIIGMGGGGAIGELFLQGILRKMGIQASTLEVRQIGAALGGPPLTPAEQAQVETTRANQALVRKARPGDITAEAAARITAVGPNLRAQAELAEKQRIIGAKMTDVVISLETAATNTTAAFTRAKDVLGFFADEVKNATSAVARLTAPTEQKRTPGVK